MGNNAIDSILSGVNGKERAGLLFIILSLIWSPSRHALRGQHGPGLGQPGHGPAVLPTLGTQPLERDKMPTGKPALSKTWD